MGVNQHIWPWDGQPQEAASAYWGHASAEGLVGLWNLGSTTADAVGRNNLALPSTLVTPVVDLRGMALDFSGSNTGAATPSGDTGLATSKTLIASVYARSLGGTSRGRIWDNSNNASVGFILFVDGTSVYQSLAFAINNAAIIYSPAGGMPLNRWTTVAVSYDYFSGAAQLYVDGEVVRSSTYSPSVMAATTNPGRIGARNDGARSFDGRMDAMALWNRALSPSEVSELSAPGALWSLFAPRQIWVPSAGGGGTSTPVTPTDATASFSVLGSVQASASPAYNVTGSVASDRSASYGIAQSVSSDASASYAILAATAVTSSATAAYSVLGAVSKDAAAAYSVKAAIQSSASAGYNVIAAVEASASASYGIATSVSQDASGSYSILSAMAVTSSATATYAVLGAVAADAPASYAIKASVQRDAAAAFGILASIQSDRAAAWFITGTTRSDLAGAYGIASYVQSDLYAAWQNNVVPSSAIDLIYKILANRQELNPATGKFTIYNDDDVSVLYQANAWADAAGTIPYAGGTLARIDRLT